MEIRFLPGHRCFEAQPEEDILSAALRAGIGVSYACRQGLCGACTAQVVDGDFNFNRCGIEDKMEAKTVLLCRTKALSPMTIAVADADFVDPADIQTISLTVVDMVPASPNVTVLRVRTPGGKPFPYRPGQYVHLLGDDGVPRSFSLATCSATDNLLELHVGRIPGGAFSERRMATLRPGDTLQLAGPFGDFHWRSGSEHPVVLLAGGTGFAPIKALLEQVLPTTRAPIRLYWGAREASGLYLSQLAYQWQRQFQHFTFVPVLSGAATRSDWPGRRGRLPAAVLEDFHSLSEFDVYACGNPAMVVSARSAFVNERGLLPKRFFADPFELAPNNIAQFITVAVSSAGTNYRHFQMAAGKTLLQGLRANALPVLSVCGGKLACGACQIEVSDHWHSKITAASDDEIDLLQCLPDVTHQSRLACQILLSTALDGLEIHLPR